MTYHHRLTKQDALNGSKERKPEIMSSIMGIKFKHPNFAIRKCVKVQLTKNGKKTLALQDSCLNYIEDEDVDMIIGFRRKGYL
ncbi:putative ribosomal protein S12/S23 [Medicago truncatula]|uniref:Putative ribosomal protein S12/S23 n=1 Tax=Medicago truncatula TaxID=3880 RepID=A0A396GYM9_MEDTR|nr:putative ribosomal protein S12/S23 [Medicago truncatula]